MSPPATIPELFYIDESPEYLIVRTSNSVEITDYIPGDKKFEIYGDELTLTKACVLHGGDITIVCRILTCGSGAAIDVSGKAPAKDFAPGIKKLRPSEAGQPGPPGDPGTKGGDAGSIWILAQEIRGDLQLRADGHDGGRGQDGTDGSEGATGPEGPTGDQTHTGDVRGLQGGRGLTGGPPGPAGKSGGGGRGGSIFIRTTSQLPKIASTAKGGRHGPIASHGGPGKGGPGGLGGRDLVCHAVHLGGGPGGGHHPDKFIGLLPILDSADRSVTEGLPSEPHLFTASGDWLPDDMNKAVDPIAIERIIRDVIPSLVMRVNAHNFEGFEISCSENGHHTRGPRGPQGPTPDPLTSPVEFDPDGKDGTVDTKVGGVGFLTAFSSPAALTLVQLAAEEAYRGGASGFERATRLLEWLKTLTFPTTVEAAVKIQQGLNRPVFSTGSLTEIGAIYARVASLLRQMSAGLDYFGLPRNYVPILSLDSYRQTVNLLLPKARTIEDAYDKYRDQKYSEEERLKKLNAALNEYHSLQMHTDEQVGKLISELGGIDAQVKQLLSQCIVQRAYLDAARNELQTAISHLGTGCSYKQILGVINTVVAVSTGTYSAMLAISGGISGAAAAAEAGEVLGTIKQLGIVAKGAGDVQANIDKMINLLQREPEAAKLIVLEEDYQRKRKELDSELSDPAISKLPQTKEFRKQLEIYMQLVQAKNEKQLEYTSRLTKIEGLKAEQQKRELVIAATRNVLATTRDPSLSLIKLFMEHAYRDVRSMLTELLALENRAFEYWSLSERTLAVLNYNVTMLETAQIKMEYDVQNSKSSSFESRGELLIWEAVDVSKLVHSKDMATFLTGQVVNDAAGPLAGRYHILQFVIAPENCPELARWPALRLSGLRIRLPRVHTSNGRLQYSLIHHGSAVIVSPNGILRRYIHPKRKYTIEYDISTGQPTAEEMIANIDADFIAPSPFSAWTLLVGEAQNSGLRMTDVQQVAISFKGRYLA